MPVSQNIHIEMQNQQGSLTALSVCPACIQLTAKLFERKVIKWNELIQEIKMGIMILQ